MLDCKHILESEMRCPLTLIAPDGVKYPNLLCRTLTDSLKINYDGIPEVVNQPNITIPLASLERTPLVGERWIAQINLENDLDGDLTSYYCERSPTKGGSIGFIRMYLTKIEQSS